MTSSYKLEFSNQAQKFLKKLKDKHLLKEFESAFELLRANPYAGKFLQGNLKGYHSFRLHGVFRILYKIFHNSLLIFIEDIAHRKESY